MRRLQVLTGQDTNAYVTQLDWSADSSLLRSNGKNGEVRHWRRRKKTDEDVESGEGKAEDDWLEPAGETFATEASIVRNAVWPSPTCRVQLNSCGVWQETADPNHNPSWDQVKAVAVQQRANVIAAGGKDGMIRLLTYPCLPVTGGGAQVEKAHSSRQSCGEGGESGGVSSLTWARGGETLVSAGDVALMQWTLKP